MIHGDDKGMVLPPRCAPIQVIVIPIIYKDESENEMIQRCNLIVDDLAKVGVRAKVDDRENYTPGWKYNDWETKGVCLRMELGPRDMKNQTVRLVQRYSGVKSDHLWSELATTVPSMLEEIHREMLQNARNTLEKSIVKVNVSYRMMWVCRLVSS